MKGRTEGDVDRTGQLGPGWSVSHPCSYMHEVTGEKIGLEEENRIMKPQESWNLHHEDGGSLGLH